MSDINQYPVWRPNSINGLILHTRVDTRHMVIPREKHSDRGSRTAATGTMADLILPHLNEEKSINNYS